MLLALLGRRAGSRAPVGMRWRDRLRRPGRGTVARAVRAVRRRLRRGVHARRVDAHRAFQLEGELQGGQRILGRLQGVGAVGRLERTRPGVGGPEGREPVGRGDDRLGGPGDGQRGVVARALVRQEVGGDRAAHELVAERDAVLADGDEEPLLERFGDTGGEIGVQGAFRAPWRGRGAWRRPLRPDLERGSRLGEVLTRDRPFREGQQAEHAAALRRAARQPRRDDLGE